MRLYDAAQANDRDCVTLAEDAEHYYDLVPMLFNHRLVMTPKADTRVWEYGWCYPSAAAALAAIRVWDPDTQNEPLGWHKRPTPSARTAPRAETAPDYNRPRCVHGHYTDRPCVTDPDHCPTRRTTP